MARPCPSSLAAAARSDDDHAARRKPRRCLATREGRGRREGPWRRPLPFRQTRCWRWPSCSPRAPGTATARTRWGPWRGGRRGGRWGVPACLPEPAAFSPQALGPAGDRSGPGSIGPPKAAGASGESAGAGGRERGPACPQPARRLPEAAEAPLRAPSLPAAVPLPPEEGKAIWSAEEVAEGSTGDASWDPRKQPEYVLAAPSPRGPRAAGGETAVLRRAPSAPPQSMTPLNEPGERKSAGPSSIKTGAGVGGRPK